MEFTKAFKVCIGSTRRFQVVQTYLKNLVGFIGKCVVCYF